jgi:hypothetical protein
MGCAGSNPLPASDTMMASATSDSRTVTADAPPMSDADKACSIVQKVVGSVNIDDVVKKIQGKYICIVIRVYYAHKVSVRLVHQRPSAYLKKRNAVLFLTYVSNVFNH